MNNIPDPKVAFVTGAAQGLGLGITQHLLSTGWKVMLFDLDADAGDEAITALSEDQQERALFFKGDIANEHDVAIAVQQTVDRFGRIDGLVNNAGIADPHSGSFEHLDWENWQRVINVNLGGAFLAAKHATQHLRKTRGAIVNIASTRAFQSEPNTEAYAASKGGMVALTHAMAVSLSGAVRVNGIAPGWIEVGDWQKSSAREEPQHRDIDRQQHPAGRIGTPDDIAKMVAFLLDHEQSGFMTGETIRIDGGMTHKMIYAD
ncbi:NAD(P)-dependent dehydrogenase, short-chain alcohol dehydrogenase family [Thalassospira xiamenensis M-5 = DSM 17429]|uniref:Short-chain dehydrogenase/reductase SDR n=1 Tax=Thalassospira xiamenensis M-5 = DSM 17429 TaxID=1123366 RepID=A0AB72UAX7_9PROT|nr:glucose 1-dehydrogenase [Thalassospira xiamenensis]AJD51440.1 short-chain dehydrogenase/reductase SDR [Thalassospira xiamenensis M-5 = DSM 17429]SIT28204.1 NAD(P)-dependent dehydrogenase, short-chain alcohol dehydrogenase family [Thalassospira xiamenensis M-5 = DSM 17429]